MSPPLSASGVGPSGSQPRWLNRLDDKESKGPDADLERDGNLSLIDTGSLQKGSPSGQGRSTPKCAREPCLTDDSTLEATKKRMRNFIGGKRGEGRWKSLFLLTLRRDGKSPEVADSFKLPTQSGFIDPVLFWFYSDLLRESYLPANKVGNSKLSTLGTFQRNNPLPVLYALDQRTGIKRCYLSRYVRSSEIPMEYAVEFNIRKLTAEKFKREFESEVLREIENQLRYVSPYTLEARARESPIPSGAGMEGSAREADLRTVPRSG